MSRPQDRLRHTTPDLAALGLYCASTLAFFGEILPTLGRSIGPHNGDPVFNLYVLKWGSHQLSRGLEDLWSAPFFHPTENALALSDHLLGPAMAFHVLRLVGVTPLAAYNLLVLATFALGGWTAYWVLRRSGVSWSGALVGGWTFSFSAFRWDSLGHFQVIRMQWIPLTVWSFDRLLERPTPRRAAAFLLFYALHVSGGAYLAYLLHVLLLVLVANRLAERPSRLLEKRSWVVWLPAAALAVGIAVIFYGGYLAPDSTLMAGQPPDSIRRQGPVLAQFVPALTGEWLPHRADARGLFPGFAVVMLALGALSEGWRRFAAPARETARPFAGLVLAASGTLTTFGGLILADRFTVYRESLLPSLTGRAMTGYLPALAVTVVGTALLVAGLRLIRGGRVLRWAEVPVWPRGLVLSGALLLVLCLPAFFWLGATLLPGMQSMRVPHRAFAFVALPLAYLVGVGWDVLRARLPGRRAWPLVAGALSLLLVAETVASKPRQEWQGLPEERDFPPYAHWIATHTEVGAYLELPRGARSYAETVPMYLQTLHWRPLLNGHSGRQPASYLELVQLCRPFPGVDGIRHLAARGTTHVVVHWRSLPWHPGPRVRHRVRTRRAAFEAALERHGARRVFVDGATEIYDIRGP